MHFCLTFPDNNKQFYFAVNIIVNSDFQLAI